MNRIRLHTLFLLLVALASACGSSSRKGRNTATAERYFVLGDPRVMIEGTSADTQSFITTEKIADFDDYTLAGFTVFAPKIDSSTIDRVSSQEELEEANKTDGTVLESELNIYSFTISGGKAFYQAQGSGFDDYPKLEFTQVNNRWELTAVSGESVLAEHYSLSQNGRVFSVLVSNSDELGNYLAALTFTRIDGPQKPVPDLKNSYQYIVGTGIAVGWAKSLKISICGDLSESNKTTFSKSISNWSIATGDASGTLGGLAYEIEFVSQPKPFNDVNQHCINLVKNYRLEDQEDLAVFGVTLPTVDFQEFTLVDSHIFIFDDALARFREPVLTTATHEVGHLLGLGHEFSRSSRGVILHPSIMGYSGVNSITSWDAEAILALYPRTP